MQAISENEYRKERQSFIGGSDIGALLGINPLTWTVNSPLTLYLAKTMAPKDDTQGAKVKTRGKVWESVVSEMLCARLVENGHSVEIVSRNEYYTDDNVPYFKCEVDMVLRFANEPELVNCELKTVHPFKLKEWGEEYTDAAPLHYVAQTQWGLGITRRKLCILAALFGADDLRVYPVRAEPGLIAEIRGKAHDFWNNHVLPRVPPAASTVDDIDAYYLADNGRTADFSQNRAFISALSRYKEADSQVELFMERKEEAELELKSFLGETQVAKLYGETVVTWKNRKVRGGGMTRVFKVK